MHHCLTVSEILHLFYEELDATASLHLALACKAFLEPGLDKVWFKIHGFDPLVACLPEGSFKSSVIGPKFSPDCVYTLTRDLEAEDLSRYLTYYAPRIRHFAFGDPRPGGRIVLSMNTLEGLKRVTNNRPGVLSPNLTRFEWFPPDTSSLFRSVTRRQHSPYVPLFLGDQVTALGFEIDDHPTDDHDVDTRLHQMAMQKALERFGPQLEYLDISGLQVHTGSSSDYKWDQLRELRVVGLVVDDTPALATLPRLATLIVFEIEYFDADDPRMENPPIANGFRLLEHLEGVSGFLSDVDHILRHLPPKNKLKTLIWSQRFPPTVPEFDKFTDIVGRKYRLPSLVRLEVVHLVLPDSDEGEPLEKISIASLFPLKNIEDIELDLEFDLDLTPDVLSSIPRAWPRLQRMRLCLDLVLDLTPKINFTHVIQIAHDLPHLVELGLKFDGTVMEDRALGPQSSTPAFSLHTLDVGLSPIDSPPQVAAFMRRWLPGLRTLEDRYYSPSDWLAPDAKGWEDVRRELGCKGT